MKNAPTKLAPTFVIAAVAALAASGMVDPAPAHATNLTIPSNGAGMLVIAKRSIQDDGSPSNCEFGLVQRNGSGEPSYLPITVNDTYSYGEPVYRLKVTAGQKLEFYVKRNATGRYQLQSLTLSSDPTKNTGIDPTDPEHTTWTSYGNNYWLLAFDEWVQNVDAQTSWPEGVNQESAFLMWIEPPCNNTTQPCPDPNATIGNHAVEPPAAGRDFFRSVGATVASAIGPSIGVGKPLGTKGQKVCLDQRVDNRRFTLTQESIDFSTHRHDLGGDCGGEDLDFSGPHDLKHLEIKRYHRPNLDYLDHSSFGIGVFSEFDISLTLYTTTSGEGPTTVLFDPRSDAPPIWFSEKSAADSDTAINGLYHDNQNHAYKSLVLLNSSNQQTASLTSAKTAKLTKHNGEYFVFELIRTDNSSLPSFYGGRLTRMVDRNGNAFVVNYVFPANATPAQVGYDSRLFWDIASVVDMTGYGALFATTAGWGRRYVSHITWYTTADGDYRDVVYGYQQNADSEGREPDRLVSVTYSNGDVATFDRVYDPSSQHWQMTFADVAEGNGKYLLYAFLTGTFYSGTNGQVFNQAAGLLRVAYNGEWERIYQNWEDPNDPGTVYYALGYGQGLPGSTMTRLKTNAAGATLELARAVPYSDNPFTATYKVDETYLPASQGFAGKVTNGLGQALTLVRNAITAAISEVMTADGKKTTVTMNGNQRITKQVDQMGVTTQMTYDPKDNLQTVTAALGTPRAATWTYTYNSKGLMTSMKNPLGFTTDFAYDSATGNLLSVTEPADVAGGTRAQRKFEYDYLNRRSAEIDAAGRRTTFTYDDRGRLIETTYPDGSQDENAFGTGHYAGVLAGKLDRNGVATTIGYDVTRRPIVHTGALAGITAGPGPQAVFTEIYYPPGRAIPKTQIIDGTVSATDYDERDRPISQVTFATDLKALVGKTTYDDADRVLTETDPYNRKTYYVYDANGRVLRKAWEMVPGGITSGTNIATLARSTAANPKFVIEDKTYDAAGRMISATDGKNVKTTYTNDELGRPTSMVRAAGTANAFTTTFEYDLANNLTKVIGPRSTTVNTYTRRNLQDSKTVASGLAEAATYRKSYTLTGRVATMTDPSGGVTTNTYSPIDDVPTTITDAMNGPTVFTYDKLGHPLTKKDANNNTTTYKYDMRYRIIEEKDMAGKIKKFAYDDNLTDGVGLETQYATAVNRVGFGGNARGHAILVTSPAGEKRFVIMDGMGRKVIEVDHMGNITQTSYDTIANNLVETTQTNALGKVTKQRQDRAQNLREVVDQDGNTTLSTFDAVGNALSARDPNSIGATCVYDELRRQTSCTNTAGEASATTYDFDGNVLTSKDAAGNTMTCTYDARGRQKSCTDRLGLSRSFTYDARSNVLSAKDAQNGTTNYTYDALNRRLTTTFPDAATDKLTSTFDLEGRLLTTKDQSGNTLTMGYDTRNRLVSLKYPDAKTDTFSYNDDGQLTGAFAAQYGVTTARTYDGQGRLSTEKTTVGTRTFQVSSTYDELSRLKVLTYPDNSTVTNTYGLGRDLVTEVKRGTTSIAKYAYDAGSRLKTTTFGNGLVETATYVTNNTEVAQLSTTTVGTLVYTYDKNHNKLTEKGTAAGGDQTFGYDKENRLTSWSGPSLTQSWTLSGEADWLTSVRNGTTETRTHDAVHQLTKIGTKTLTYDARGNLTQDDATNKLTWDLRNMLKQYQKNGGATVGYLYDALGRRVAKTVGTATTVYVPYGSDVVAEVKDGTLVSDFIHGPSVDNTIAYYNGGRLYYVHKDPLNTVKAVTNDVAGIAERYRYTAYGERTILSSTGAVLAATAVANNLGFTGRPHDPDTGLIDFRSRAYDARLGRFVSRDAKGYTDGLSMYAGYFAPNHIDPTGHSWLGNLAGDVWDATGGAAIDKAQEFGDAAVDLGRQGLGALAGLGSDAVGLAGDIGTAAWNGVAFLGTELWGGAKWLGGKIWQGGEWLGGHVWRLGGEFFSDAWAQAKMVFAESWSVVKEYGRLLWAVAYAAWQGVTGHPLDAFKTLVNGFVNFYLVTLHSLLVCHSISGGYRDPIGGPTTIIGLGFGLVGWARGGGAPEIHWFNGGFIYEFPNSKNPFPRSITIGRTILYNKPLDPTLRAHERAHVRQYGVLAEGWIPIHLTTQGASILAAGHNPFTKEGGKHSADYNPFEKGPEKSVPWPTFPRLAW